MVSGYEAVKLQRDMHRELDGSSGAVVKCAAGLAIVVLVSLLGSGFDVRDRDAAARAGASPGKMSAAYTVRP